MFQNSFTFDGRIRRTEYGISFIIYVIIAIILNTIIQDGNNGFIWLAYIPPLWFLWAQGAKRCHDRGNSGWYQLIPFYVLWMLFGESDSGINVYGLNPKKVYNNQPDDNTETKGSDIESTRSYNQNDQNESSNNQFVQDEKVNTQTIDNEVVNKTFVPKKKPIRKQTS